MRKMLWIFCLLFGTFSASADFQIAEVMPNTVDDKNLEFISVINNSTWLLDIEWYTIEDASWKQYVFWTQVFEPQEKQQFFRRETKIILNNSNETLILKNVLWEEIDTQTYKTSKKSEAIIFLQVNEGSENDVEEEIIIEKLSEKAVGEFELLMELQRPSYVTQSWSTNTYICDTEKEECKVNLNFSESFSWGFEESDYICEINFGMWELTGQENKCNPNTVIFPKGETQMNLKIYHEDTRNIIYEDEFTFIHDDSILWVHNKQEEQATLYIPKPKIHVQSGLHRNGLNFYCKKSSCKMNLEYKKISDEEECYWNFWPWVASSKTTKKRCNPGYVDIPEWSFELQLKVYEEDFPSNKKVTRFFVHNIPEPIEQEVENLVVLSQNIWEEVWDEISIQMVPEFSIELQWKIWAEKYLKNNLLECREVERCYVNFTASGVNLSDNIDYSWKLNGEEFSQDMNPKWIWIEGRKNIVTLEVSEWIKQEFYVHIFPKLEEIEEAYAEEMYEPLLFEEEKQVVEDDTKDIKKIFTQNFLVLKYDGLRISGKAPQWSKVIVFLDDVRIWESHTNNSWRYRIVSKNFHEGNYIFSTKIVQSEWEEIFVESSGETEIVAWDRVYWFAGTKKKTRTKKTTKKTPVLLVEESVMRDEENSEKKKLSIWYHILFVCIISLVLLLALWHMVLLQLQNGEKKSITRLYVLQFITKQKIIMQL